jgi:serine/threonine protein kinase
MPRCQECGQEWSGFIKRALPLPLLGTNRLPYSVCHSCHGKLPELENKRQQPQQQQQQQLPSPIQAHDLTHENLALQRRLHQKEEMELAICMARSLSELGNRGGGGAAHFDFRVFTWAQLLQCTQDWKHKLGVGGFGEVFKGEMNIDGRNVTVAVKRLFGSRNGGQDRKLFSREIGALAAASSHANIIPVLGYCENEGKNGRGGDCCIVFQFAEGGSLDRKIENSRFSLAQRLQVARGCANALLHLHHLDPPVLHLDFKPQNVLLDRGGGTQVCDFGLARLSPELAADGGRSHVSTRVGGTPGYMAPEIVNGQVSSKVDAYALGVVLLNLALARPALLNLRPGQMVHLRDYCKQKLDSGQHPSAFAGELEIAPTEKEAHAALVRLGLRLSASSASLRLTIPDAKVELDRIHGLLATPNRRPVSAQQPPPQQQKQQQQPKDCVVCMDNPRGGRFLPCAHFLVCVECAARVMQRPDRNCPQCRTVIQRFENGFWPDTFAPQSAARPAAMSTTLADLHNAALGLRGFGM